MEKSKINQDDSINKFKKISNDESKHNFYLKLKDFSPLTQISTETLIDNLRVTINYI
jgi:hypothetical protein